MRQIALACCAVAIVSCNRGSGNHEPTSPSAAAPTVTSIVRPVYTLNGTVTDGTSGGVLPRIHLDITDGTNAGMSTLTDSSGRYAIPGVTAGTFTLVVSAVSYITISKTVTVSGDMRVDIILPRVPPAPPTAPPPSLPNPPPPPSPLPGPPPPVPGPEVELRGRVSSLAGTCPTLTFIVAATAVFTDGHTLFKEARCSSLRDGMKVEVKGVRQPNGSVWAARIEMDDDDD